MIVDGGPAFSTPDELILKISTLQNEVNQLRIEAQELRALARRYSEGAAYWRDEVDVKKLNLVDGLLRQIKSLQDEVTQLTAEAEELRGRCCRYAEEAAHYKAECESWVRYSSDLNEALNPGDGVYRP